VAAFSAEAVGGFGVAVGREVPVGALREHARNNPKGLSAGWGDFVKNGGTWRTFHRAEISRLPRGTSKFPESPLELSRFAADAFACC